ncbi:MAG: ABC transporter substrate-binding protein [Candidatus Excrementavichristensenella sp.]|jgi:maltose-binding protein MalE
MKKMTATFLVLSLVLSFFCFSGFAEEEKIVIRIANSGTEEANSFAKYFRQALEMTDFYERYPNVELENYFVAENANYNQKLITMAMSGSDDFDAVWISAANVGVLAGGGVLRNLDEYYANETRFDITDNEKWIVNAVENFINYNGSRYAYPYQTDCRITFWYKPICEACGYTVDNYPKTIDEFVTFCQKVSEAGYNPWGIRNAEDWTIVYEWALPFYGSGGTFERFNEETGKWEANLDTEIGRKWVSDVRELCKTIPGDYITTMGWDVLQSVTPTGVVASHWIGTWIWDSLLNYDAEEAAKYDTTLIPAGTEYSGSSMGGWMFGIAKNTTKERADIVWEMLAAISINPEANAMATANAMPFMREAYDYAQWAQYDYSKDGWTTFQKQLETSQPVCTPPCEAGANIYAAMWTVWQECTLTDNYSIEEATSILNNTIQEALDDFYGY